MGKLNAWTEMMEELSESIDSLHDGKLIEAFNQGIELAIGIVARYKTELLEAENTVWLRPNECAGDSHSQLYLAYQPGYPLMIADWKVGRGFRDVRTDISINPTLIARINAPGQK